MWFIKFTSAGVGMGDFRVESLLFFPGDFRHWRAISFYFILNFRLKARETHRVEGVSAHNRAVVRAYTVQATYLPVYR